MFYVLVRTDIAHPTKYAIVVASNTKHKIGVFFRFIQKRALYCILCILNRVLNLVPRALIGTESPAAGLRWTPASCFGAAVLRDNRTFQAQLAVLTIASVSKRESLYQEQDYI